MKVRLGTVFSGIGAIEMALRYEGIETEIIFACDNGERELPMPYSEIDKLMAGKSELEKQRIIENLYSETGKKNLVKQSYFANYKIDNSKWFEDIKYLDGKLFENKLDLYVGGSPCQSFSVNGKRAGLEDVRGTLFYEFARIIKEAKPKVFIYENVRGMLNHDQGRTWKIVKEVFDDLDYDIFLSDDENPIVNAKDYGIPQNRERVFVIGFKRNLNRKAFRFPKKIPLTKTVFDYIDKKVDAKYYLGEKGFKFVTQNPSRARVGTSVMGCQKANQQFNWNGDFIFEPVDAIKDREDVLKRAYIGKWKGQSGVCRKYTPRECLRLMGFRDDFKIIHKDEVIYRQAGNSIVVNVLMELVKEIVKTGIWEND